MNKLVLIAVVSILTGCAATGENLKGNVYKAGQVNTAQAARGIRILKLMPAQVEVDNSQQKQQAQVGGAVLGALAGDLREGLEVSEALELRGQLLVVAQLVGLRGRWYLTKYWLKV